MKAVEQAGLTVTRVEIEPTGTIVLHMPNSVPGHNAPDPVLEAVRRKIAIRRAEHLALETQR